MNEVFESFNYKERDRLIELISQIQYMGGLESRLADHLLENGVVVLDTKIVTPQNRPLITQIAGMPINDVLDLLRAKKEGRLIVPPCKVGQTVWYVDDFTEEIEECKVYGFNVVNGKLSLLVDNGEFKCITRKWHNTKEEAEEKLRERSGEDANL